MAQSTFAYLERRPGAVTFCLLDSCEERRAIIPTPTRPGPSVPWPVIGSYGDIITLALPDFPPQRLFLQSIDGGKTFTPVCLPQSSATSLSPRRYRLHGGGTWLSVVLSNQEFLVRHARGTRWAHWPVPEGFAISDLSIDMEGSISACGSVSGPGVPPDKAPAIYRLVNGVAGWIQPPLFSKDERKLRDGSDGVYFAVDTEASPWLVATEYFTIRDALGYAATASDSYILTKDEPCWSLYRTQGQYFAIVRELPGQLSLYQSDGRRCRMAAGARSWRSEDLTPAIEAAGFCAPGLRPVLCGVAGGLRRIILVAELYTESDEQRKRLAAAVLTSEDDGETFRVRAWSAEENCDYCGVGVIRNFP